MGIIMYSWCRRPGGCGACSLGTALYPEPDVSGQNHSTQDSSRILRSHDRMERGREKEREKREAAEIVIEMIMENKDGEGQGCEG